MSVCRVKITRKFLTLGKGMLTESPLSCSRSAIEVERRRPEKKNVEKESVCAIKVEREFSPWEFDS